MKKVLFITAIAAAAAASCAGPAAENAVFYKGKALKGFEVVMDASPVDGLDGMTVRNIGFVNTTGKDLLVDAMETSAITLEGGDIWSLQPSSTAERKDWVLPVPKGFYQKNYLGMNDSDYGGGIPMVSLWNGERNVSVGLAVPCLETVNFPVERKGNTARASILLELDSPVVLEPGDTLFALQQFVWEGKGDFFRPLRAFSEYMQEAYGFEMPVSPEDAYEPVWCAWGYERNFTVDEVIGTLPKVVELGFKWVDIDDGYQICEGDWTTNDRIGPEGMKRMTDAVHAAGLKAKIWWAPMAADPESSLAKEHPEPTRTSPGGTAGTSPPSTPTPGNTRKTLWICSWPSGASTASNWTASTLT